MSVLSEYFSEHLHELRHRVFVSFAAIALASGISYYFSEQITLIFLVPLEKAGPQFAKLVYTNLTEAFISFLKISILSGIILSFPIVCYEVWMFIAPGLHKNEKKLAVTVVFWSTFLFSSGVAFAYFAVLPEALSFLMGAGGNNLKPLPKFDSYLTFVARSALAFGLAFEIPFLMVMVGKVGFIKRESFVKKRMYYYFAILALALLLTAGDIFSMVLVAIPLFGLYESGILIMRIFK